MRHGLRWYWLLVIALVGCAGAMGQRARAVNIETYNVTSTSPCTFVKWNGDNRKDYRVWADFQCGDRTVTVTGADLLVKYLKKSSDQQLVCKFKIGTIVGDEKQECDI